MLRDEFAGSVSAERRLVPAIIIVLAITVFVFSIISITSSRRDSFTLLVKQGKAFTNALAEGSANAITAQSYYDRFQHRRYADLIDQMLIQFNPPLSAKMLAEFADRHDLRAIYLFDTDSQFIAAGSSGDESLLPLPELKSAVTDLLASPDVPYALRIIDDSQTGEDVQYYLEIAGSIGQVVVIAEDAVTYNDALRNTGIGYLAQRMARSPEVEYIIYQTADGIIFSSTDPGQLPAIESDTFLQRSLANDSVASRIFAFQGEEVLELVRSFATPQYEIGVLRVGMSLTGYFALSRAYNWQIVILTCGLIGLISLVVLYARSRHRRKELSREVSRIKSFTDTIFEQMRVGIAAIDNTGVIRLLNREGEQVLGISKVEGRHWREVITSPEMSLEGFLASGARHSEAELKWNVGNISRELLIALSKVSFENDSESAVVVAMYDITDLKKYERESARRERLSEMGNLAAGVAHEIRNPLNTISIAAQRLATEFSPSQNADEYLEFTQKIRSETKRLNDIITRFLTLARENQPVSAVTDVGKITRNAVTLMQVEADKLGISIRTDLPIELTARIESDKLRELLLNLYNNAKEALKGAPGNMTIVGSRTGDTIEIRFADNGPGIPEIQRTKVFAPYFTTKEAGTGLGLATVHRIVTSAGGTIRAEETPGGGATFVIGLPVS